jgi:DUF971 family protein
MNVPPPTELKLKAGRRELEISFPDGIAASLSAEYLRVHSPSAEVTQHGSGEGLLVVGKENVAIARIEPVGRYAVRLIFDDGHSTGLYTWAVLHELCRDRERKWRRYLERLTAAGHPRPSGAEG